MRILLAMVLVLGFAFGSAVTWQEDTLFRTGTWTTVHSGRVTLGPADTSQTFYLAYYPWTQLWAYAIADSNGGDVIASVEWSYGTFDPYNKTEFHWSEWAQALPSNWTMMGGADSIDVPDSLYLGPLIDVDVPLAWVDRARFRVIADTASESLAVRFWVRRRSFTEGGDVMQILPWWFFPN